MSKAPCLPRTRYRRIRAKAHAGPSKSGCGGMILTHDFNCFAVWCRQYGTANDLGGYQHGVGRDFCRLMSGAKVDAEFRIESAGSLLVIPHCPSKARIVCWHRGVPGEFPRDSSTLAEVASP